MRTILPLLLLVILFSGCKKAIQKMQEDAIISAMTDGEWKVTSFKIDDTFYTDDFTNYRFKYYADKTVDAKLNGTVVMTGTWDGDAETMTTTANFTGATTPLSHINGSWHIDNNSWTYVLASQAGSSFKVMRLDKL
jgi:hypothetical protein